MFYTNTDKYLLKKRCLRKKCPNKSCLIQKIMLRDINTFLASVMVSFISLIFLDRILHFFIQSAIVYIKTNSVNMIRLLTFHNFTSFYELKWLYRQLVEFVSTYIIILCIQKYSMSCKKIKSNFKILLTIPNTRKQNLDDVTSFSVPSNCCWKIFFVTPHS